MDEREHIDFTLRPTGAASPLAVRLRRHLDRWVAELVGSGQPVAIGLTAREALSAALLPLGDGEVNALLADVGLLGPSVRVLELERATRSA